MSLCCLKKMSDDKTEPVKKFFRCPDLVEKLLPYLPASDMLSLAEAGFSCVLMLLKRASVWETLVKKTLGLGDYSISDILAFSKQNQIQFLITLKLLLLIFHSGRVYPNKLAGCLRFVAMTEIVEQCV